jgi:hypothetical protein
MLRVVNYPNFEFEKPPIITDYQLNLVDSRRRLSQMQVCVDCIVMKFRNSAEQSELILVLRMHASGEILTNHSTYSVTRLAPPQAVAIPDDL